MFSPATVLLPFLVVKLLHLSDVGIAGRVQVSSDDLLSHVRESVRTAFRRAVGCALREQVDAVLVAGGLYDDDLLDYGAEQFLLRQLARLDEAGIRCFWATGPADPGGPNSQADRIPWPESLHRFGSPVPEAVVLEDDQGKPLMRVVGAGFAEASDRDALRAAPSGSFPPSQKSRAVNGGRSKSAGSKGRKTASKKSQAELPQVGLLHAPAARAGGGLADGEVLKVLRDTGYTYWALGGASRHGAAAGEEEHIWHAGPTAGRGPSQPGPQGGLLVTLEEGKPPQAAFRPFAPLCWADLVLDDLEDVDSPHALLQRAARAFEPVREEGERSGWIARFTLAGGCPLAPSVHRVESRRDLEHRLAEHLDLEAAFIRTAALTMPAQPDRHRDEPHVLSEALALLDQAAADSDVLRSLAPDALAGFSPDGDADREPYLRGLLDGLDREACARLLVQSSNESSADGVGSESSA